MANGENIQDSDRDCQYNANLVLKVHMQHWPYSDCF